MHLVDRHRRAQRVARGRAVRIHSASSHEYTRSHTLEPVFGGVLGVDRVGVGLLGGLAVAGADRVLVRRALAHAGTEALPDAGRPGDAQRVAVPVPAVEVAHHADRHRVRGPDREVRALFPAVREHVRAEQAIGAVVGALVEQVQVLRGQQAQVVTDGLGGHREASSS